MKENTAKIHYILQLYHGLEVALLHLLHHHIKLDILIQVDRVSDNIKAEDDHLELKSEEKIEVAYHVACENTEDK